MTLVRSRNAAAWVGLIAAAATLDAWPADLDVEQLRRDVHELERTVSAQGRRIEQLERALSRNTSALPPTRAGPDGPPAAAAPRWLAADRWRAITERMTTQQVVEVLGPPTAVRIGSSPEERVLLYTLELDIGAFLSGSIRMANDRVVGIETPVLR